MEPPKDTLLKYLERYNTIKKNFINTSSINSYDSTNKFLRSTWKIIDNIINTKNDIINERDSEGKTALIHLCSSPFHIRFYKHDKTIFDFLIKQNADINIKDNEGKSALMCMLFL